MHVHSQKRPLGDVKKYFVYLFLSWTGVIILSVLGNIYQLRDETLEKARIEARTIFEHNIAYRRWNTMNGGVYVPVTDESQPNQYIVNPRRDVTTTDGMKLTLVNPFQMTKRAYQLLQKQSPLPTINRTVSLQPLNPDNSPDEWEKIALSAFEKGQSEVSTITNINGQPYMRVLKPYITVKGCLVCHGFQGYKIGDIRGGMSIAVPMKPYYEGKIRTQKTIAITHLLLWSVGMIGIVMFSRNIQRQQQKLTESERKFRTLSEFSTDWEYWIKEDMEIVFMSPSCEAITGYTQEDFSKDRALLCTILHPEDKAMCERHHDHFRGTAHDEMEYRIVTKNGQVKWLHHACNPILMHDQFLGRRVSNRDITDRKHLEEQLMQSQKMESLGLLAGGIAHDFNNLLTGIIGYSALLQNDFKCGDERAKKYMRHIMDASERAQNLTSSLLAFSRKQIIRPRLISLNEVINNISGLLGRLIGEDIDLRIRIAGGEVVVFADPSQLEQVIMNLATNARDAMPSGGVLEIETAPVVLNTHYSEKYNAKPGKYMMLSISDTGSGIDKEDLAHIFEPFFTTKEKGKGTGLGLSTAYGIIKQHEGFINVYSERGMGSSFKIYLPSTDQEHQCNESEKSESGALLSDYAGSETVLVGEDEEVVRHFLRDILQAHGYTVILSRDGEDAIDKYKEHKGLIDIVILDVIMPKKNGKEVYHVIREINEDIRVLFVSGYPKDILTSKGVYKEGLEFVEKPLDTRSLLSKIRSILNER